jgi:hypothetical protein
MITTADALDVMTVITACHRRTAPRMDDREVAIATATIWAELFNVYKLDLADLIAGVKQRALTQAEAPEPAEIITAAKEIRRLRAQSESRAEREAREDRHDAALEARNRDRLAALAAGFGRSIDA